MKMAESSLKWLKTLVTSNFSFSRSVFKSLMLLTRKNQGLLGKGLIGQDLMHLLHKALHKERHQKSHGSIKFGLSKKKK